MTRRKLTIFDSLLNEVDQALRVIHTKAPTTERDNPADAISDDSTSLELSEAEALVSLV